MEKEAKKEAKKKKHYIFTDKKNPPKAIMSTILGTISVAGIVLVVFLTFQAEGVAKQEYGTTLLLCMIFSLIGMILGILSRLEKDMFYFFSYLGMFLNLLALAAISVILYAGAYGL